jgi:hypothetical protein
LKLLDKNEIKLGLALKPSPKYNIISPTWKQPDHNPPNSTDFFLRFKAWQYSYEIDRLTRFYVRPHIASDRPENAVQFRRAQHAADKSCDILGMAPVRRRGKDCHPKFLLGRLHDFHYLLSDFEREYCDLLPDMRRRP